MLVVHHLNDSRSQRILWLLEELGAPYEIKYYQRDAKTRLAPPELKAIHPLGKSPVVTEGDLTLAESGAIVDHIVRRHGGGRLAPAMSTAAYDTYQEWLHYSEGSAMLPVLMTMYLARAGEAVAPIMTRVQSELANHLGYVESALAGRDYLMGKDLTAADVQMSFVGEMVAASGGLGPYPNIAAWVARLQARPAYKIAVEKGGPYRFAK